MLQKKTHIDCLFVGGPTGGHVYPLIAMAQQLGQKFSLAFIGTSFRQDASIVTYYRYNYFPIFKKEHPFWLATVGVWLSLKFLFRYRPKLVVGSGGNITFPFIVACIFFKIPYVLHEQNVLPGRVNRLLCKKAKKIMISFEESRPYFAVSHNLVLTGNPVREDNLGISCVPKFSGKVILILGGSQGALFINEFVMAHKDSLLEQGLSIILITGDTYFKKHYDGRKEVVYEHKGALLWVLPYVYNMQQLYLLSTWVVSRAGASTLSDLMAYQKKAILIPYPYAKDGHQHLNADIAVNYGIAIMLDQKELSINRFYECLDALENMVVKQPFPKISQKPLAVLLQYLNKKE